MASHDGHLVKEGLRGGLKRGASAAEVVGAVCSGLAEGAEGEVEATSGAECASVAVEVAGGASLVATAVEVTGDAGFVSTARSPRSRLAPGRAVAPSEHGQSRVWRGKEARLADAAASRASASAVFRRSARSSADARACSAAAMSEWRRAKTCASISVVLLAMSVQLAAMAALKGVDNDTYVS